MTEQTVTTAARRILEAKYDLGLFDDPYKYTDSKRAQKEVFSPKHLEAAKTISAQSMVLMKNDKQVLPLKKSGTVAVIGPLGDNALNMPGTWSVAAKHANSISLLRGLKETVGKDVNFVFAKGSNIYESAAMEEKATMFGKTADRDSRSADEIRKEAVAVARKQM